jgi:hypothetical protein
MAHKNPSLLPGTRHDETALRLRKRALLRQVGLPVDPEFVDVTASLRRGDLGPTLDPDDDDGAYVITVLPDSVSISVPMPPFFELVAPSLVFSRSQFGVRRIEPEELLEAARRLPARGRMFRGSRIWRPRAIAGRLMYCNAKRQRLELETDTVPRLMGLSASATGRYAAELVGFEISAEAGEEELSDAARLLLALLAPRAPAFAELEAVGQEPTIEFALRPLERRLYVVDVDWADQWEAL